MTDRPGYNPDGSKGLSAIDAIRRGEKFEGGSVMTSPQNHSVMTSQQVHNDIILAETIKWYQNFHQNLNKNTVLTEKDNALLVIIGTPHIRNYLIAHDPKALEQCKKALENKGE